MTRPDDHDLALSAERETRLEAKWSKDDRETYELGARRHVMGALKKYADSPEDALERIALRCSKAFRTGGEK